MRKKKAALGLAALAALLAAVLLIACQAAETPEAPAAPSDGEVTAAGYVGSDKCAECHSDIAAVFNKSGHPFKLNKVVGGRPPEYPFTEVPSPPEGYTWNDVTYVIGGYNWKARFIDKDGYIITGADENATTQYNLPRPDLGFGASWTGYHAGEKHPYDTCGPCHTTGYSEEGNQDGLPGLIGTWSEPGIRCEACHGPGKGHVDGGGDKSKITVNTSSALCGKCHVRGEKDTIPSKGGFIRHHEQYNEMLASPHKSFECVTCHDPHEGVVQARQASGYDASAICQTCHAGNAEVQKSAIMKSFVDCIDCHMPRISKSAQGDAAAFSGDIRTHLWRIDADTISQFNEEGTLAITEVSLEFACKTCHRAGGMASAKSDEELKSMASGYHEE